MGFSTSRKVMSDIQAAGIDDLARQNAGWLVATAAAIWGWILKLILGRHLHTADRIEAKVDDLIERVSRLEGRADAEEA